MIEVRGNRNRALQKSMLVLLERVLDSPSTSGALLNARLRFFAVVRAARPRESRPEKAAVRDFMGDIEITWPGESNSYLPDR